jgi:hypothetical protein
VAESYQSQACPRAARAETLALLSRMIAVRNFRRLIGEIPQVALSGSR